MGIYPSFGIRGKNACGARKRKAFWSDPQELDNLAQQQKGTLQEMDHRIQERWLEGRWDR